MKKFIAHILVFSLFSLVIFGAGSFTVAHAQQQTQTTTSATSQPTPNSGGALSGLLNIALTPIVNQISVILLTVASWITMLGGIILNFAVNYTVVNMAQHFSTSGGGIGTAINNTWVAIRDLANMSFIFVLLYAAIMTMFGRGNYKKTVVNMVIAAILINFSLFFTKVIIDAANLLTMLFYNAAAPGALADTSFWQRGLSNSITNILGFSTIFKLNGSISAGSLIITGVMGSVVLLICGFIFFAVAIMFVIRYVVLVLVMILSPIMFVGMILPGLGGYTKQWWTALSSQAFFAPIFMLLMWVSITVMNNMGLATDYNAAFTGSTASVVNGVATTGVSPTMASTFINFAIVIVFIIASLLISKKYSERAGGFVNQMTKSALGYAGGATLGVAGRFARGTVGRAAQSVADDEKLKDRAASGDMIARLQLAAARKTASSSFDLRGTVLGKPLGAGKAQEGGFAKDMANRIDREKKHTDTFKPSDLVIAQAEQALARATDGKSTDKENSELIETRDKRRKEVENIAKERNAAYARRASKEEMDALNKRLLAAQKKFNATNSIKEYAQDNVDELKGVDEKEAKRRVVEAHKNDANFDIDSAAGKAEIESTKRTSAVNVRKEARAQYLEKGETFGKKFAVFNRIGGVLGVKKEVLASAVAIRKSTNEKRPADLIADAIKNEADAEAKKTAGGASTTPPTPPAGGTTPPTP